MSKRRVENTVLLHCVPKKHCSTAWIHADGSSVQLVHKPTGKRIIAFRNL